MGLRKIPNNSVSDLSSSVNAGFSPDHYEHAATNVDNVEMRRSSVNQASPNEVLPLMRHVWFPRSFVPREVEAKLRGRDPDEVRPVVRPLVADLLVSYATPTSRGYHDVSEKQRREWGMDPDELHQHALQNLRRRIEGRLRSFVFQTFRAIHIGDELEASTLLLDEVWDRLATEVQGDLRVVVAARPMVAFTGIDTWGEDGGRRFPPAQCVSLMAGSARLVKGDFPGATLSDHLLARDARSWRAVDTLDHAEARQRPQA